MAALAEAGAELIDLDLTRDKTIIAAIETIRTKAGRIDVLVNNAGYGSYGAVEDVPMEEARRQVEVNLFGLARLCQLATPMMRAQGSAPSSTSRRSAASSASRSAAGITRRNSRSKG